ncbi:MAG: dihydroorotate dehydrogenase electron transfer subunit [Candidatus Omnitrophica bacterium]|nr:dihydroorotate dehydrogenase electron transfer subunit [Candidatus Omnitrophota bacterium]
MKSHYQEQAEIIRHFNIAPSRCKLILRAPTIAKRAKPGQFVHVRTSQSAQVLLRRPFSVHRARPQAGSIEIAYEIAGRGTELLSEKRPGVKLDIIGPLGNGFDTSSVSEAAILVAGGMGVAPLIFLAEKLTEGKRKKEKGKIVVLIGAKSKSHLICVNDFKKLGCEVRVATDDGSAGFKGKVTDLLRHYILRESASIYACGPLPMLKIIGDISRKHNIPAQVSMEQFMGCGLGACMGCVIETRYGYKRVCHDGPVFDARDIM